MTPGSPADLTIVIPTYNERDRLSELVRALFDTAAAGRIALEVIVVDDDSADGTGAVADELARTYPMRVIHRAGKLGLGTAVVAGFAAATSDVVGCMDADFSHPPSIVPRMLKALRTADADIVVASRYIPGGGTSGWPWRRRLLSRAGCFLARPLSPIRDAASGFFLIRRSIVRDVAIKAGGFKICLELIMRGWPVRLAELPYVFADRERGQSKMSLREASGYLLQLKDLYLLRLLAGRRPKRYYRRFAPDEI